MLDGDSLTWTIVAGKLEINVCKASEGLVWQRFMAFVEGGDEDGGEVVNPDSIDEILEQHSVTQDKETNDEPLPAFNAQELEDCDALPDDAFALHVIDGDLKVTHKANLSGHQLLFGTSVSGDGGRNNEALCLRHDVDGLVWSVNGQPSFKHVGTFAALGYVQASKAQRKYTVSPPGMGYAAIVEATRRVFLYRQPSVIPSEFDLRNRKTGKRVRQVAKQQVLTLDAGEVKGSGAIQGAMATDDNLILATEGHVHCFKVNE